MPRPKISVTKQVSEDDWLLNWHLGVFISILLSSKVEMGKWIEDLNQAIDLAKMSLEKSGLFLDSGQGDRSNSKTPHVVARSCSVRLPNVQPEQGGSLFPRPSHKAAFSFAV